MWRDLQYAFLGLRRTPGVALAVTVSLGLAIGANATIFGAIDALWLRPPGAADPGALMRVFSTSDASQEGLWSFPEYRELRDRTGAFSGVAARGRRGTLLQLPDGTTELELVNVVSLNFFTTLGVNPAIGRLFGPDDAAALERSPGVVLGNDLWRRRYGSDPSIVGKTVTIGRRPVSVTVLGVLPERFRDLEAATDRDLWLPPHTWELLNGRQEFEQRDFRWFDIVARRQPGIGAERAATEVEGFARDLAVAYPASNRGRGGRAISELSYRLETGGVNAFTLLGLVLLVVVITCVNIANLQLARAGARVRELAVRTALGASRGRLLRQLMAENLLLGGLGAAAGLLIAAWIIRLLPAIIGTPPGLRAFAVFALDTRVALFTLAVATITTIAFGLAPSWLASRPNVVTLLKTDAGSGARSQRMTRAVLVSAQVATAVVLLTAAALFARSFATSNTMDLGFARKPVTVAWVLGDVPRSAGDALVERLRALPGVRNVAVALRAPLSLSGGGLTHPVLTEGADPKAGPLDVKFNAVTPNYFSTMGIRVLEGRVFTAEDERAEGHAIVVSERFARRFFPGATAIDRRVRIGNPDPIEYRIVGIVEDVAINAVNEEQEPIFYLPFWQHDYPETTFLVETQSGTATPGAAVRATMRDLDRRFDPRMLVTMEELVRYSGRNYRWTALLAAVLATLGLLLTAIGVYGVVSFSTARRTREIGIRLALGATRGQVLGLVMRDGVRLAIIGLAAGIPAALGCARLLSSLLLGVRPGDLLSFTAAAAIVLLIVTVATFLPARRAVRVPPSTALRVS